MKKIFFSIIIFFATENLKASNDGVFSDRSIQISKITDTTTYPIANFIAVDWGFYIDKPINILLQDLDNLFPGYILGTVYANERLRMAGRINVYYGQGRGLILGVSHFQFMNPYSDDGTPWDVNSFRQEKISNIELWDNAVCVYKSNP